jgi:beta-1,4-mannosyl-glycoprotein beta-1,4-N-acetylglucosaminyltransferase
MLFDCFMYFDEAELLELRIEMLKDIVDGFIITDADRTFKGDKKEFTCVETIKKLGLPEDKIQVLHCELPPPETHPNPWVREYAQRDALGVGMRMCPPDSVFFFSDVDEIPKKSALLEAVELAKANPDRCVRLSMPMFYGRGDLRVMDPKGDYSKPPNNWTCGTVVLFEHLTETPSQIRMKDNGLVYGNCDAGWHFSWMGDSSRMKRKLTSFSHCYDVIPNAHAPAYSQEMLDYLDDYKAVAGGTDPLGRCDHVLELYPHELLPEEVFKLERVKEYLLPDNG